MLKTQDDWIDSPLLGFGVCVCVHFAGIGDTGEALKFWTPEVRHGSGLCKNANGVPIVFMAT